MTWLKNPSHCLFGCHVDCHGGYWLYLNTGHRTLSNIGAGVSQWLRKLFLTSRARQNVQQGLSGMVEECGENRSKRWTTFLIMSGMVWALCRTWAEVCRTCPACLAYFAIIGVFVAQANLFDHTDGWMLQNTLPTPSFTATLPKPMINYYSVSNYCMPWEFVCKES